ncbi:MAG: cytochrome c [Terracidiphilus sp.]
MGRILFGFIIGLVCIPGAFLFWLHNSPLPVAVADKPLPYEDEITGKVLQDRINKELLQIPPLQPDDLTLVAGAHIYRDKCAVCHGYRGKPSTLGENMYPAAPPLWEKQNGPVVGVSNDLPGATYWKVANGIRLSGMPGFRTQLNDTEIWQVSLLLSNANKPLPPEAISILGPESPSVGGPTRTRGTPPPPATTLDE